MSWLQRTRRQRQTLSWKRDSKGTGEALPNSTSEQYVTSISPPITILEIVGILSNIVIEVALLLLRDHDVHIDCALAPISTMASVYLLLLLVVRSFDTQLGPELHSRSLYVVQWLCTAWSTHGILFQPSRRPEIIAIVARLCIFTVLCAFHLLAPRILLQGFSRERKIVLSPAKDETASFLSRLTFAWVNDLVWRAFRRPLEITDLPNLGSTRSRSLLQATLGIEAASSLSLLKKLYRVVRRELFAQGAWAAVTSVAVFTPPVLMRYILEYLESQEGRSYSTAWMCVTGLLVAGVVASIADCQCNWTGRHIGTRLRSVLMNEIYSKLLQKSVSSSSSKGRQLQDTTNQDAQSSDGNTLNLISVDAEVICGMSENLYLVWLTFPMQTVIGTYLLFEILGISGVIGVLLMIVLLPLNFLVSKRVMTEQSHVLTASDARIQTSNELLQNIRTVKYCAWETHFSEKILASRGIELKRMRSRFIWWSISMTLFHSLPFVVTILTCFFYVFVWNNELGTAVAFPALAIFTVLRIPLNRMADSITFLMQANVSLQRVKAFLQEPDTKKYLQLSKSNELYIGFENATLTWPTSSPTTNEDGRDAFQLTEISNSETFTLHGLNIVFRRNGLNTICGPSGSGKSSLLLALLGEMNLLRGRVHLPHGYTMGLDDRSGDLSETTAYCPQEPWIMNRTIRANILTGLPFNSRRYEAVLAATALLQDLKLLQKGDETLAGEHGNRLSGGQKQRLSIARALYSNAKYVVLDDCFSALDSRTANHVFFHAIKGPLMHNRTCILATHNTRLTIAHSEHVVILDAGHVKAQGRAEELVANGLIDPTHLEVETAQKPADLVAHMVEYSVQNEMPPAPLVPKATLSEHEKSSPDGQMEEGHSQPEYAESKVEGAVPLPVVKAYLQAMGTRWYWAMLAIGFALQQVASLGTNLWVKEWALRYDRLELGPAPSSKTVTDPAGRPTRVAREYYLAVYCLICISYASITFLRDLLAFHGSLRASSAIYKRLLNSVLHAKLLFFDKTPLGQITNRFTRDIEILDQSITSFSISLFQLITTLIAIVILISVFLPAFLLIAVLICLAFCGVTAVYISGARDLKRIEAVQRSPLYQQFGETIAGCVSIRAYALTGKFRAENQKLVNDLNRPSLLLSATKEWLMLRISVLSSLISFAAGACVLYSLESLDPGAAAISLTMSASVTENVLWLVQIYAIIQQNLNSIERICEYTEGVEREPAKPLKTPPPNIPYNWPSRGRVRFSGYTTRYAPELDPSLRAVSFTAEAGERVAIVGRTGAGKSTLSLALIRALEAEGSESQTEMSMATQANSGGLIEIDGVDIASVTLQQLRQAVTVVPQDPKLFDGSLRDNLSPMHLHTDEEMLEALRIVRLLGNSGSSSKPRGSKSQVNESDGSNAVRTWDALGDVYSVTYSDLDRSADSLSRGQRQLLCIARGLLRRSRILVLDEATASVDNTTDASIQASLRASVAAGTTVLAIVHRLLNIADYDRVVVLDAGRVIEQGTPKELLARRHGTIFRRMCEESGNIEDIEKDAAAVRLQM